MASITDYLKSKGFSDSSTVAPFFDTKKKVYESLGFGSSLGEFRGTAEQNTALLSELSKRESSSGVSLNPSNIYTIIGGTNSSSSAPNYSPVTGEGTRKTVGNTIYEFKGGSWTPVQSAVVPQPAQNTVSLPQNAPTTGVSAPQEQYQAPEQVPEEQATGEQEVPSYLRSLVSQAYSPTQTAEELTNKAIEAYTSRATYPLEQEQLAANKAEAELNAQREKESFITDIASRGLIFSGKKTEGLKTIEADKLSKLLGIDRNYAILVAQGLESASQQIAKEAQKGNEDAISTLEKLGYILVDGQLIQKPSEARAEESAARSAAAEERAETRLDLSLESAQRAEEAAARSAANFEEEQSGTYKISSSKINKYINAGIPSAVANDIYQSLQLGMQLDEIRPALERLYGRDKGYAYLDKFMPIFEADEGTSLADYLNG